MKDVRVFGVSGYGLLTALGFLAAYGCTALLSQKSDARVRLTQIDSALLWLLIPAVGGARALFVIYHLDYFVLYPQEIIAIWHGGWVWHGGLLGGILGAYVYCKRAGIAFLSLLDILTPGVALGQAIGRWGNFLNQEAYGLPTNLPWALTIDPDRRLPGYESFVTFHPTFLYESVFDIGLFLLLWLLVLRYGVQRVGLTFFMYLSFYSLGRFGIEFLRIDSVPIIFGLRAPQWISLGLLLVGVWGLARVLRKQKKMVY